MYCGTETPHETSSKPCAPGRRHPVKMRHIENAAETTRVEAERVADAAQCADAAVASGEQLRSVIASIRDYVGADLAGIVLVLNCETRLFAMEGARDDENSVIPRSISIADYAIGQRENLVEFSGLRESEFGSHPFVMRAPHASTYTSCTLFSRNHYKVGAVFLMRTEKASPLTASQRRFVSLASRTCESLLWRDSADQTHTETTLGNVALLCHELRNLIGPACMLSDLLLKHANVEPVKSLKDLIGMLKSNTQKSLDMVTDMQHALSEERRKQKAAPLQRILSSQGFDQESQDEDGDQESQDERQVPVVLRPHPQFKKLSNRAIVERYEQLHDRVIGTWQEDVLFPGSVTDLHQVFANLISNAYKYSEQDSFIYLSTWTVKDTANRPSKVVFSMRDTGPGIKKEHMDKLFSKYGNRLSESPHGVDSTGYGLYVCRKIVEDEHGGTIRLNTGYRRGCDFHVELPIGVE